MNIDKPIEEFTYMDYVNNWCFDVFRMREEMHAKKYGKPVSTPILKFIWDFFEWGGTDSSNFIYQAFRQCNCYYFAIMLKDAFPGGEMVWMAPLMHMCYLYEGIPYDVNGVCVEGYPLPITELHECLENYKHRGHDKDLRNEFNTWSLDINLNHKEIKEKIYNMVPEEERLVSIIPKGVDYKEYDCVEYDVMRHFKMYKDRL